MGRILFAKAGYRQKSPLSTPKAPPTPLRKALRRGEVDLPTGRRKAPPDDKLSKSGEGGAGLTRDRNPSPGATRRPLPKGEVNDAAPTQTRPHHAFRACRGTRRRRAGCSGR